MRAANAETPAIRPPAWFIIATGVLAATMLLLAVSETNLKAHYLIDQGEFISVVGLGFMLLTGWYLFTSRRLSVSLPLLAPWLLYPIITQGDQVIDNLSINPMRAICDVLLAAIFATPVAVFVLGTRALLARRGRSFSRAAATRLAAVLMTAEIPLAQLYLGRLMIVTLVVMIAATLLYGLVPERRAVDAGMRRVRSERVALAVLLAGFAVSLGTYLGYKNAAGAYQGSPSFFMDPSQQDAGYRLDRVAVPAAAPSVPVAPDAVRDALTADGRTLDTLLAGYHILDRNYTYDFHNELFLRRWPLLPDYRGGGLRLVAQARRLRADAESKAAAARALLRDDDPLAALLDDLRGSIAFAFDRSSTLERLSGDFAQTKAGLQHAAHLYEGESKYVATSLAAVLAKHHAVFETAALTPVTAGLAATARTIDEAYGHHVVGF